MKCLIGDFIVITGRDNLGMGLKHSSLLILLCGSPGRISTERNPTWGWVCVRVRACACTCVHVCTCVRVLGLLGNGRMGLIQGCQSALGIPVCKVSDGPSSAGTLRPQHTHSAGSPHLLLSTFLMWLLDRGKLLV